MRLASTQRRGSSVVADPSWRRPSSSTRRGACVRLQHRLTLVAMLSQHSIADAFLVRFRLPYRLYLDEEEYHVRVAEHLWTVRLADLPEKRLSGPASNIVVSGESQLWLDSWGFLGATELSCAVAIDPPEQVAKVVRASETCLRRALTAVNRICLLYTSPSPRDGLLSRMPSSA